MSTFGGGYKISGAASSGGAPLGAFQCAFTTYFKTSGAVGAGDNVITIYYGPGASIANTHLVDGNTYTFSSGVIFIN